jgi:hypothetical protein
MTLPSRVAFTPRVLPRCLARECGCNWSGVNSVIFAHRSSCGCLDCRRLFPVCARAGWGVVCCLESGLSRVGTSSPVPPSAAVRSWFPLLSASCKASKSASPQDHHLLYQQRNRLFRRVYYSIYQHPLPSHITTRSLYNTDAFFLSRRPSALWPFHTDKGLGWPLHPHRSLFSTTFSARSQ